MSLYSFNKSERLKSRKVIKQLFEEGSHTNAYPLKIIYLPISPEESIPSLRLAVTVSKRNFKRAVDRNRIKRLIREAYRLNKIPVINLLEERKKHLAVMAIYIGKEMPDYHTIEKAMIKGLSKLEKVIPALSDQNL